MIVGFSVLFFYLYFREKRRTDYQSLSLLQQQLNRIGQSMDSRIAQSIQAVKEVTKKLVEVEQAEKQVADFARQLQDLQDILSNPKQRGVLGEYYLETTIKNVLPPENYKFQYEFKDGKKVDAVILVEDKLIPVDSKFSLENYNRLIQVKDKKEKMELEKSLYHDLKARIDETARYIRPEENTLDFAFMFIPSEALYYDLLINKVGSIQAQSLIEYAFKNKRVIVVSPTTFLAYLQTVLQGLRALRIEETAKQIRTQVEKLERHFFNVDELMKKLGSQLGTVIRTYNQSYQEFGKAGRDIAKITGKEKLIKPESVDLPEQCDE